MNLLSYGPRLKYLSLGFWIRRERNRSSEVVHHCFREAGEFPVYREKNKINKKCATGIFSAPISHPRHPIWPRCSNFSDRRYISSRLIQRQDHNVNSHTRNGRRALQMFIYFTWTNVERRQLVRNFYNGRCTLLEEIRWTEGSTRRDTSLNGFTRYNELHQHLTIE